MPQLTLKILLGLLLLALVGCPPGRGGGGGDDDDDDDSASDDDDATGDDDDATGDDDDATGDDDDATGDDDDATSAGDFSENPGDLPCEGDKSDETVDVWSLSMSAGQTLVVQVDTVAAATTFDPAVTLYGTPDPDNGTYLTSGDDDFDCTFPPPEYRCPEATTTTEAATTVGIIVENYGCPGTSALSEYVLRAQLDGSAATPTLVMDDYQLGSSQTDPPQ